MTATWRKLGAAGSGRRDAVVLVGALLLFASARFLLQPFMLNEWETLPAAKYFVSPEWLAADWYFSLPNPYRALFNIAAGALATFMDFETLALVGRFASFLAFAYAAYRLCRAVDVNVYCAIPLLFLFVAKQSIVAKEWMIAALETKPFAYACLLLALAFLVERKYAHAMIFLGLTLTFHALVGAFAIFCFGVAVLAAPPSSAEEWRRLLRGVPLFVIAGAFGLFAIGKALMINAATPAPAAASIYVHFRAPHHLVPSQWSDPRWPWIFGGLIVIVLGVLLVARGNPKLRALAVFAAASAVLFSVGLLLDAADLHRPLRYYWFRLGDATLPFVGCLFVALGIDRVLREFDHLRIGQIGRWACVAASGALMLYAAADLMRTATTPREWVKLDADTLASMQWIRNETPDTAVFLVSPFLGQFHVVAQRPLMVSFKNSPQLDADITNWYERIKLCNGGNDPQSAGWMARAEIEGNFYRLSRERLLEAVRRYNVRYYLGHADRALPFATVYRNQKYALYALDQPLVGSSEDAADRIADSVASPMEAARTATQEMR